MLSNAAGSHFELLDSIGAPGEDGTLFTWSDGGSNRSPQASGIVWAVVRSKGPFEPRMYFVQAGDTARTDGT